MLTTFPLRDIWGIGRRYGKMFDGMGIRTALQFVRLSREWVHARMGVTGLRMWNELQGVECIAFEQMPPQKQQITVSRSFPKEIYEQEPLERIVAEFASMCAESCAASGRYAAKSAATSTPTVTATTGRSVMKQVL